MTAAINYVGVRSGSFVQNLTTIAKYFGLLFVVVLALGYGFSHDGAAHFTPATPPGSFGIAAFGLALVSVLWAYDGWADLTFISGEIKDPRRNIPRALIIGTGAASWAIYLLANIAYLAMFPVDQIRTSPLVAADVAGPHSRRRRRRVRRDHRDDLDLRHAERIDLHVAANLLRDGRRGDAVPAVPRCASTVRDAASRDPDDRDPVASSS